MKKLLFILFAVVLIGFTWFYSTLWLDYRNLEADYSVVSEEVVSLEEQAIQDRQALEEALSELRQNGNIINALEEQVEEYRVKYMPLFSTQADARSRFVTTDTPLFFLPGKQESRIRDVVTGTVVQVIQKTTNLETGEEWLYVQVPIFDTPQDNRGYIPLDTAIYFTPDLERRVVSPLTVKVGATLYSGEEGQSDVILEVTEREMQAYLIGSENGRLRLGAAGGMAFLAEPDQVIYPESPLR